jgi:hypothetical protein
MSKRVETDRHHNEDVAIVGGGREGWEAIQFRRERGLDKWGENPPKDE